MPNRINNSALWLRVFFAVLIILILNIATLPDQKPAQQLTEQQSGKYPGESFWYLSNDGRRRGQPDADMRLQALSNQQLGQGITVAVIDGHFNRNHKLLRNSWWQHNDPVNGVDDDGNGYIDDGSGWDFSTDDNNPFARISAIEQAHATAVAGLVRIIAPKAKLMPISVISKENGGSIEQLTAAIEYASDNGADVINLSVGLANPDQQKLQQLLEVIKTAEVPIIAAAGNDAVNNDAQDEYAFFPAALDAANLISVAASDADDHLWQGSNYGLNSTDLVAPGVKIDSPSYGKNRWLIGTGTSSAAPLVSGVSALLLSEHQLSAAQLRVLLAVTSDALSSQKVLAGRINVTAALHLLENLQSPASK